jgi:beta-lactam-binding protein with PASTA domain
MRIGKKLLACAAGIVPLTAGLAVAGSATAAHAIGCATRVPMIINDDASFADGEISEAGLVPQIVWLDGQGGEPLSSYLIASTNPAPNHVVNCGTTVFYTVKATETL